MKTWSLECGLILVNRLTKIDLFTVTSLECLTFLLNENLCPFVLTGTVCTEGDTNVEGIYISVCSGFKGFL